MRLNAYLARAGVASRRAADELIKAGRVTVNGAPGELNTFVASGTTVDVDGKRARQQRLAYVLLHKPAGVVTTARDPHGRPTVVDLVGRSPARRSRRPPRRRHDRRAAADERRPARPPARASPVRGRQGLRRGRRGTADEGDTPPPGRGRRAGGRPQLSRAGTPARPFRVELTIHEGRKHQVKRMLEAVGHPVVRLHRSRYAGLSADDLAAGRSRELAPDEVAALRELVR